MTALRIKLARWAIAAALLGAWEFAPRAGLVDAVFIPPVSRVVVTIVQNWKSSSLGHHAWLSTLRALGGFGVATVVGTVMGVFVAITYPRLADIAETLVELLSQVNPVVLFHIVLLFFGIGESAKIFVIAWMCTWPILFSAIGGVRATDPELVRLGRSFGLDRCALAIHCLIPAALPSILTGMRLSCGYAFIMLVATEMMGTSSGLGWFVVQSQESYHAERIFAGATVITLLALLVDSGLKCLESLLIDWKPEFDERRVLIEDVVH